MRAAVIERYGPPEVVRVVERDRPEARKGEVLVRVRSAAVTSADARIRGARFPDGFGAFARVAFGVRRPRRGVLGGAFSGEVAASNASGVAVGDEVCGMTGARMGAHAEFVAVRADRVVRKPDGVSHDDAAGVLFGGSTALFFLWEKASVSAGKSVLVYGASGAIGTNAVQLAKRFGATVTGVSTHVDLVTELGADRVIDYTNTAVTGRYDVVIDTVGALSIRSGRELLTPQGVLALVVAGLGETVRARGNVVAGVAPERAADFTHLLNLVADKELAVVIERTWDLADIVDAHRLVDSGRKVGNVVVRP